MYPKTTFMKFNLLILVIGIISLQSIAQGKLDKLKAKDFVGTTWRLAQAWRIDYDSIYVELTNIEQELDDNILIEFDFINKKNFKGTTYTGFAVSGNWEMKREYFNYEFENDAVIIGAWISIQMISSNAFILEGDFCNDACNFKIMYHKK